MCYHCIRYNLLTQSFSLYDNVRSPTDINPFLVVWGTLWGDEPATWCQGGIRTHNEQPYDSIEPTSFWNYWSWGLGTMPHYTPDKPDSSAFYSPQYGIVSYLAHRQRYGYWSLSLVLEEGLEPSQPNGQQSLNLSCLPIPPSEHFKELFSLSYHKDK